MLTWEGRVGGSRGVGKSRGVRESGRVEESRSRGESRSLQTCIVHLLRQSLDFANRKQRKPLAVALRAIYTAPSADLAQTALDAFERSDWGQRFPAIVAACRWAWARVAPFFAFLPEIRLVVYTTNALESVHAQLRRAH